MRPLLAALTAISLASCSVLSGVDEPDIPDLSGSWVTDATQGTMPMRMDVTEAEDGNIVGEGFVETGDSAQFLVSGQHEGRRAPMLLHFDSTTAEIRQTRIQTDRCGDAEIEGSLIVEGDTVATRLVRPACR